MSAVTQLRRDLPALARLEARAAALRQRIAEAGRQYSYEQGYRVPLRLEQIKRELEIPASDAVAASGPPSPGTAVEANRVERAAAQ